MIAYDGVIEDIIDRKKVEEALLESEESYRFLFDDIQNGFALHKIILDNNKKPVDYVFLDVNKAFEMQTGLKKEDITGKCVTEVLPGIINDPVRWIENYGGDITVFSEPGKGTSFSVYLPVIDTEFEVFEAELFRQLPRGEEHILLIDDEEQVLKIIEILLVQLGYTITALTNGVEALEEFRRHPDKYDLVLTDLMMPKMNGIDLARGILEIRPGMPIILCTGFGEKRTQEMSESVGISANLMKPLLKNEMAIQIRKVLDNTL